MDSLTQRNIKALADGLRTLNDRLGACDQAIAELRGINAALSSRLAVLEQTLTVLRVQNLGRGPTA